MIAARLAVAAALLLTACEHRPAPAPPAPSSAAQDAYRRPDRLIAALGLHPGDSVAELGAGGGYLTARLAAAVEPNGRVLATDIDTEALAALRARTASRSNVSIRQVQASDPGLGPDTFDLILLAQVDHLLLDRAAYLRALRPSLKLTGRIAISNGDRHRQALRDAAIAAGFSVEEIDAELPAQFLFVLRPAQ